jgi:hypothetical protein
MPLPLKECRWRRGGWRGNRAALSIDRHLYHLLLVAQLQREPRVRRRWCGDERERRLFLILILVKRTATAFRGKKAAGSDFERKDRVRAEWPRLVP